MTEQIFDIAINDKLTSTQLEYLFKYNYGSSDSTAYEFITSILSDIKNGKKNFTFNRVNFRRRCFINKFTLQTSLLLSRNIKKVTRLDLIVTENPLADAIGEFTSLKELNIILLSNIENYLPPAIEKLNKLTSLTIISYDHDAREKLKIPHNISKITSLKHLKIIGRGEGIYCATTEFRNSGMNMRDFLNSKATDILPEAFGNLVNLLSLKLTNINLRDLPTSFEKLVHLEYLSIKRTALSRLPDLKNFIKLKSLQISAPRLEIPDDLYGLTALEKLSLHDSRIRELSENIGNLINLKVLELYCNKLKKLPKSIDKLTNLEHLWITANPFEECDLNVKNFPKLNEISIKSIYEIKNKLKKINLIPYKAFSFERCAICLETVDEGILTDFRDSTDLKSLKKYLTQNKAYTHANNQIPHNDFIHAKCWKGLEYCPICRQK